MQIPNGVTTIGDYVFEDCESLMSINLPNGITSIGVGAFNFCKSTIHCTDGDIDK